MALLSADDIFKKDDTIFEVVDVPEWGGEVRLRSLTGQERDKFEAGMMGDGKTMNMKNIRAKLVVMAAVDEAGKQLFAPNHDAALGKKSAAGLSRLYNVAARLSGLTKEDLEEIAGNSESDQSDDSGSSCPGNTESSLTNSSSD
jgi:hypothetical protein